MTELSLTPEAAGGLLSALIGEWQGINRTWFQPNVLADESPIQGSIRALPGSHFVIYEYSSVLQGSPFHGVALYGYNSYTRQFEGAWADGLHMSTNLMFSSGGLAERGFFLLGNYVDPDGGPNWGWRTLVEVGAPDHLLITCFNISPQGQEARALEASYRRKQNRTE